MDIGRGYLVCFVLHHQGAAKLTVMAVQDVPDPKNPATWSFQLQTTWHRDQTDVISLPSLKAKAINFAEPFRSANLWIPEGTRIYENKLSYWIPIAWDDHNGRITLAGDAAHPMTFRMLFTKYFASVFPLASLLRLIFRSCYAPLLLLC